MLCSTAAVLHIHCMTGSSCQYCRGSDQVVIEWVWFTQIMVSLFVLEVYLSMLLTHTLHLTLAFLMMTAFIPVHHHYPDRAPLKEVLGGQYNYREGGRQVLRQGA